MLGRCSGFVELIFCEVEQSNVVIDGGREGLSALQFFSVLGQSEVAFHVGTHHLERLKFGPSSLFIVGSSFAGVFKQLFHQFLISNFLSERDQSERK